MARRGRMNGNTACSGHSGPVGRAACGVPWETSDLRNSTEGCENSSIAESQ